MKWDDYQLILALAREKSIRRAAQELGCSHSTVSRRLALLNQGEDGPLIQISPSGLFPSKAGRAILQTAEKMEELVDEATRRHRAVEHRLAGPLTISIPVNLLNHLLMQDVQRFAEAYPEIRLRIDATDRLVNLDRADADIVIRTSDTPPEHWVGRRLFPYAISFYGHRDYITRHKPQEMVWIAPPDESVRWKDWRAASPLPDAPIGLTISNIAGRFEALKNGLGLARAACFMADPNPDLVRLPKAKVYQAERLWILSHPDLSQTPKVKTAIKFFADALKKKKGLIEGAT